MKQQEQENYKMLTLSYKQVREFKHDIENQFLVLNDMLENNDTDSAKEYLVKLLLRQLNIDSPYISLYELFRGHIGIVVVKSIDQLLPK